MRVHPHRRRNCRRPRLTRPRFCVPVKKIKDDKKYLPVKREL